VGLWRGPLSLVSTTEELLERKNSGSGLEVREYDRRDPSRWPRGTIFPQKLALTSLAGSGRSVGIVRSRIQTTEFFYLQQGKFNSFFVLPSLFAVSFHAVSVSWNTEHVQWNLYKAELE
jgi:hypothetical protein